MLIYFRNLFEEGIPLMKEEMFIKINTNTWNDLELMCNKLSHKGNSGVSSSELKHFLHLFRQGSHHLAYAKTHYPQSNIVPYLNTLIGKCNTHIYASPKISVSSTIKYITRDYPKLLRSYKSYILLSFGTFFFGFILSMVLVFLDVNYASLFIEESFAKGIIENGISARQWDYPLMSSYIMVNNITVALKSFLFGITLGLGTLYILFYNGAMLGALTALIYLYDNPIYYWSLILPHGIIELTAIFISGGAGLIIAKNILIPGALSRKHALIQGCFKALSLMGMVVVFLIIAAVIEGFYTPLPIGEVPKLIFSGLTAIILIGYFISAYFYKQN